MSWLEIWAMIQVIGIVTPFIILFIWVCYLVYLIKK